MTQTITPQTVAWDLLTRAEESDRVLRLARERASCDGFACPQTPGEYLYWIEYEIECQEDDLEDFPGKAPRHASRLFFFLQELAGMLRDLGFEPQSPRRQP